MSATYFFLLLLLPLISAQSWGSCADRRVQSDFSINRYMGTWFEIAKIPNSWSKGRCSHEKYSLKIDGSIDVANYQVIDNKVQEKKGTAVIQDKTDPAKLGVSFSLLDPYSPYWVLKTDYTNVSVVYSCTNVLSVFHYDYAWIYSRRPYMSKEALEEAKLFLLGEGIDLSTLEPTVQNCRFQNN